MDIIRKAISVGLGVISLTKDKADELVDDLIKRGELESSDRLTAVQRLLKEAQKQELELEQKITRVVQKVIDEVGLPTKKDLEEISRTLKRIETKISSPKRKNAR